MIPSIDIDHAFTVAVESVKKAGEILKSFQKSRLKTRRKIGYDIVTEADILAQEEIINHLKMRFPDHYFISEELDTSEKSTHEFQWIIDPLDVTINYVSGLPFFSSSVALQEKGDTILGVIYDPIRNELYTSIKGQGSFLNRKAIRVSDNSDLGNSVLTFMLTSHYNKEEVTEVLTHIGKLSILCRGLRLYVSQALELAYLASGKIDGTLCIKSRGFSASAGVLIVREAGGKVTDLNGREFDNSSRSLLATNSLLHHKILHTVMKTSNKS
jgi:myo-inositol-1(or 4)-monophosphatase